MIDDLVNDLKRDEGWRQYVYKDSEGYFSIGYGFLVDASKGGGLPKHIGEQWLLYAASTRWYALCSKITWILDKPEHVQRAVANLCYQCGVNGVLKFKKMLAALEADDMETAEREAYDSQWARKFPRRAKRVINLMVGHESTD